MAVSRRGFLTALALGAAACGVAGCDDSEVAGPSASPGGVVEPSGDGSPQPVAVSGPAGVSKTATAVLSQMGWYWWGGSRVVPFRGRFWTMATKSGGTDSAEAMPEEVEVVMIGLSATDPADIVEGPRHVAAPGNRVDLQLTYPDDGQFHVVWSGGDVSAVVGVTVGADGTPSAQAMVEGVAGTPSLNWACDPSTRRGFYSSGVWHETATHSQMVKGGEHRVVQGPKGTAKALTVDGKPWPLPGMVKGLPLVAEQGVMTRFVADSPGQGGQQFDLWRDWSGKVLGKVASSRASQDDGVVWVRDPGGKYVAFGNDVIELATGKIVRRPGCEVLGFAGGSVFGVQGRLPFVVPAERFATAAGQQADMILLAVEGEVCVVGSVDARVVSGEQHYMPGELYVCGWNG